MSIGIPIWHDVPVLVRGHRGGPMRIAARKGMTEVAVPSVTADGMPPWSYRARFSDETQVSDLDAHRHEGRIWRSMLLPGAETGDEFPWVLSRWLSSVAVAGNALGAIAPNHRAARAYAVPPDLLESDAPHVVRDYGPEAAARIRRMAEHECRQDGGRVYHAMPRPCLALARRSGVQAPEVISLIRQIQPPMPFVDPDHPTTLDALTLDGERFFTHDAMLDAYTDYTATFAGILRQDDDVRRFVNDMPMSLAHDLRRGSRPASAEADALYEAIMPFAALGAMDGMEREAWPEAIDAIMRACEWVVESHPGMSARMMSRYALSFARVVARPRILATEAIDPNDEADLAGMAP